MKLREINNLIVSFFLCEVNFFFFFFRRSYSWIAWSDPNIVQESIQFITLFSHSENPILQKKKSNNNKFLKHPFLCFQVIFLQIEVLSWLKKKLKCSDNLNSFLKMMLLYFR